VTIEHITSGKASPFNGTRRSKDYSLRTYATIMKSNCSFLQYLLIKLIIFVNYNYFPGRCPGLWTCTPSGCSDDPVGVEFQSPARIAGGNVVRDNPLARRRGHPPTRRRGRAQTGSLCSNYLERPDIRLQRIRYSQKQLLLISRTDPNGAKLRVFWSAAACRARHSSLSDGGTPLLDAQEKRCLVPQADPPEAESQRSPKRFAHRN